MYEVLLIAGDAAQIAFGSGERDVAALMNLGFCQKYNFSSSEEKEAFIEGVRIGSKTITPWLFDLTESILFRDA